MFNYRLKIDSDRGSLSLNTQIQKQFHLSWGLQESQAPVENDFTYYIQCYIQISPRYNIPVCTPGQARISLWNAINFRVRDMNFSILQCNIVLLKNILEKGSAEFRKGESSIAVILEITGWGCKYKNLLMTTCKMCIYTQPVNSKFTIRHSYIGYWLHHTKI